MSLDEDERTLEKVVGVPHGPNAIDSLLLVALVDEHLECSLRDRLRYFELPLR